MRPPLPRLADEGRPPLHTGERVRALPLCSVAVTFSRFLPRYGIAFLGDDVVAGSRDGLALAIFRLNRAARPRLRGQRNPSRASVRTDFTARHKL